MNTEPESLSFDGNLRIDSRADVVDVRQKVRNLCEEKDFSLSETTRVVTATSELARNIIEFSGTGEVAWKILSGDETGLELIFRDDGPGIEDVEWAMQDGTSSGTGLGKGLPGAEKLMDEMKIETARGEGTSITIRKWTDQKHE